MRRGIIVFALVLAAGTVFLPGSATAQEGLSSILIKLERIEARLQAVEASRASDAARFEEQLAQIPAQSTAPDAQSILAVLEPRLTELEGEIAAKSDAVSDSEHTELLAAITKDVHGLMSEVRALAEAVEAQKATSEEVAVESHGEENGNGNGHSANGSNGHAEAKGSGHNGNHLPFPDANGEVEGDEAVEPEAEAPAEPEEPAAPIFDDPEWKLSGFAHMQYNTSSHEEGLASGFRIRRARFTVSGKFNQHVSGKIQPDFGGGSFSLKDAYVKLSTLTGSLNLTMGQFKQPFDLFELTSDTKLEVIERSGTIDGISTCPGVGGMCAYGRFTGKLGYAGRDVGVKLDGKADGGRIAYAVSFTNGSGPNKTETNDKKTVASRVTYTLPSGIRLSGNASMRDYDTEEGPEHAKAYGFDVEIGSLGKPGFHSQIAYSAGDNWKNLGEDGSPIGFRAAQALAGYRIPVTRYPGVLDSIEPVARVSWGDPGQSVPQDGGMLFTPGVMFHLAGGNNIAANLDVWAPETGKTEWSFKIQTYLTLAGISSR